MSNRNHTVLWLSSKDNIIIKNTISLQVRGVYGIFVIRDSIEVCLYVGKSYNIYNRMFKSNGHLVKLKNKNHFLSKFIDIDHDIIEIRLLETVDYVYDNYFKDMQRLASVENKFIDFYQNIDQCLYQVPEGCDYTPTNSWLKQKKVRDNLDD